MCDNGGRGVTGRWREAVLLTQFWKVEKSIEELTWTAEPLGSVWRERHLGRTA